MFKPFHRDQEYLLPPSLQDLIPDGDLVYVVAEAVNLLNLHPLYVRYHRLGQNAYHPGMLLSILFYAYARGTFSSRRIADQLRENVRFMYLSGMQRPDFRTLSDFRKDHSDLLKIYFVQIVQICQAAGMISLRDIAIDGSKIKASASERHHIQRHQLMDQLKAVENQIDRLFEAAEEVDQIEDDADDDNTSGSPRLSALRDKLRAAKAKLDASLKMKQVNTTDIDCRIQNQLGPGYNAQIAVDCGSQVVLSAGVISEENDRRQLLPMVTSVERNTQSEKQPKKIYADAGYASAAAFETLASQPHIDVYAPTQEQINKIRKGVKAFDKSNFQYNLETRTCVCPAGHPMRILRCGTNKSGNRYVNFIGTACPACPSRQACTQSKSGYRNLVVLLADHYLRQMEAKMASPAGKIAMQKRSQSVEPVFGILKEQMGFRSFRLRGLAKVNGEFALLCAAFNLKKLHKWLKGRPLGRTLALCQRTVILTIQYILKLTSSKRVRRVA